MSEVQEPVAAAPAAMDPARIQQLRDRLVAEQNLPLALLGGAIAALVGAAVWAAVTVATKYQIGWMAVGVGFLVGFTVRALGKGISKPFGWAGALLALVGCLLGNILSLCGFVALQESVSYFQIVLGLALKPWVALSLLRATFTPMDLVFYAIAVYEGYKFSFRQISREDVERLTG